MSKHQENNNREEEVDLGSLFVIIGRGFSKFFNFIGFILKKIYFFFIHVLLFVKIHFLKIIIAGLIGASAGAILEYNKADEVYASDMVLQPNFKSSRQLYNNIEFYNSLVEQESIDVLASVFNIRKEEAASLRKFEIEPLLSESDIVESYYNLVSSIDSIAIENYSYNDFKSSFTEYDYKFHKLHVESIDNTIFPKLAESILSSVISNQYFNKLKVLNKENLYRSDSILRENLYQLDTLRKVYMEVMKEESKKNSQGTILNLGDKEVNVKELELFEISRTINKDLKEISEDIMKESEIINVVSNFQPVGYEIKSLDRNYIFLLSALGILLVISFLLLKKLNSYLNTFKQ